MLSIRLSSAWFLSEPLPPAETLLLGGAFSTQIAVYCSYKNDCNQVSIQALHQNEIIFPWLVKLKLLLYFNFLRREPCSVAITKSNQRSFFSSESLNKKRTSQKFALRRLPFLNSSRLLMLQMRGQNLSKGGTFPSPFPFNGTEMNCSEPGRAFQHTFYAVTYTIIFIPGLLTNSIALWILCLFIRKQNKAIIFLLNLATADFIHVLSLPLRIYYYINYRWPFGFFLCQLCFYLKYLNMYASICFLTCISVQRYLFLLHPFKAKNWKKRYDVAISAAIWLVVGVACLTFPLLRKMQSSETCFSDLNIEKFQNKAALIGMLVAAELVGFVFPLAIISYCTFGIRASLRECQMPLQNTGEKQKALRMVSMCAVVFFVCFAPYHLMFFFFMLVKEDVLEGCAIKQGVLYLHPFFLSLASFNCCLDPFLYFFVTSEFHGRIPSYSSLSFRSRLLSKESTASTKG